MQRILTPEMKPVMELIDKITEIENLPPSTPETEELLGEMIVCMQNQIESLLSNIEHYEC